MAGVRVFDYVYDELHDIIGVRTLKLHPNPPLWVFFMQFN